MNDDLAKVFILLLLPCLISMAQAPEVLWTREYGPGMGWDVRETRDHGFILSGDDGNNIRVIRTDIDGNTVWNKTYLVSGSGNIGTSVIETPDSGFIVVGRVMLDGGIRDYGLIMRLNKTGDTLWTKHYGTDTTQTDATDIQATPDGNYIITGENYLPYPPIGFMQCDIYLLKINPSGDTLWASNWGYGTYLNPTDETMWSVKPTLDGGYIVAGYTDGWTVSDVLIAKTDADGNCVWYDHYGHSNCDAGFDIVCTPDSGYMVLSETNSYGQENDFYVIKTDKRGSVQWYRLYGGAGNEYAKAIDKMPDGGFVLGGETDSYGSGGTDAWVVRTNSSGDTLWTKTIGGPGSETCWSMQRTFNNCLILGGIKDGNIYLAKLGPEVVAVADDTTGNSNSLSLSVFPNPCKSSVNVKFNNSRTADMPAAKIALYDATGSLLKTIMPENSASTKLILKDRSGNELPAGVYFLRLFAGQSPDGQRAVMINKIR